MKKTKVFQLQKLLYAQDDFVTISYLAGQMNVSQKSVRNYLPLVEEELGDIRLLKVPSNGIKVDASSAVRMELLAKLVLANKSEKHTDVMGRVLFILYLLLIENKTLTLGYLEDSLFISRPSIYKDLEMCEKWLNDYELGLIRSRKDGYSIDGGEKRIRLAIFNWCFEFYEYSKNQEAIVNEISYLKKPIDYFTSIIDKESDDYRKVFSIISQIERQLQLELNPTDFKKLVSIFIISIKRINLKYYVSLSNNILDCVFSKETNDIVAILIDLFKRNYGYSFPILEISYLSMLLLSNDLNLFQKNFGIEEINKINRVIKQFNNEVYALYNIENRKEFEDNLFNYIARLNNNYLFGQYHYNPIRETIIDKLPTVYNLSLKFVDIYEQYKGIVLPPEEITNLSLIICSAVEQSKKPINALFVYEHNKHLGEFAMSYLKSNFKQLNFVEMCSENEALTKDISNIDIIITQRNLKIEGIKQLVVPLFLGVDVVEALIKEIALLYENRNKEILINNYNSEKEIKSF